MQQRKKFARIEKFGEYMPQLRKITNEITNEHISLDGFAREKVFAIVIRFINSLYIRMGTEKSVKQYRTYEKQRLGKSTLQLGLKGRSLLNL